MIELGFLVALGGHEQVIQAVLVAVFPEQLDERQELLALGLGCRTLRVSGVDEVFPLDDVAEGRSQPIVRNERVEGLESSGLFFRKATPSVPPVRTATLSCTVRFVKTFFQKPAR